MLRSVTIVLMSSDRTTKIGIAAIVLLFVAFVVILWSSNALVFTGTESSAKVVSAHLTLVGAFLGNNMLDSADF